MPTIRIFPSSPGDVLAEREAAERVVARLGSIYRDHVRLELDPLGGSRLSRGRGLPAADRRGIGLRPGSRHVLDAAGWRPPPDQYKRADGRPYESGTVFEIETALDSYGRSGKPAVLVFRCERPFSLATNVAMRSSRELLSEQLWKFGGMASPRP